MRTKHRSRLKVESDLRAFCHKLMNCALAMISDQKVALGSKKVGDPCSKQ